MSTLNVITAPISEDKLEYVKAFLNALKIQFRVTDEQIYSKEFVESNSEYDNAELTGKQKDILNERLENYKNNPESYLDIEEVKSSIKKNYEI